MRLIIFMETDTGPSLPRKTGAQPLARGRLADARQAFDQDQSALKHFFSNINAQDSRYLPGVGLTLMADSGQQDQLGPVLAARPASLHVCV